MTMSWINLKNLKEDRTLEYSPKEHIAIVYTKR